MAKQKERSKNFKDRSSGAPGRPIPTGKGDKQDRRDEEIADTAEKQLRGGKRSGGGRGRRDKSRSNPESWYTKNNQFTRDAGNVAAATPLGALLRNTDGDVITIPGIMAIHFIPTIGYSKDLTSPFNRQVIKFQAFLRSIQRASTVYDAADIGMYMMSMDSAFMFWGLMRRAYRVALLYTPMNKYYPRTLLQSMGFDASIADNLAEFRMYINKYALSLGAFSMPESFDINARHMWMVEGLYLDSESSRSQTYIFVPDMFWTYNNLVPTGSQLDPIWWQDQTNPGTPTLHTLEQVKQIGNTLIQAFANDADTAQISGDIYRAYNGKIRQLPEVSELDSIEPTFDKVVLSQIENATLVGVPAMSTMVIAQDPTINGGAITFTPSFTPAYAWDNGKGTIQIAASWKFTNRLLNFHIDNPSPEAVIEATRLTCTLESPLVEGNIVPTPLTVFPADIPTSAYIWRTSPTSYPAVNALRIGVNDIVEVTGLGEVNQRRIDRQGVAAMSLMSNFDWHPIMGVFEVTLNADSTQVESDDLLYYLGDIDNATFVTSDKLAYMHEAAMWSLFAIPDPDHVAVMG